MKHALKVPLLLVVVLLAACATQTLDQQLFAFNADTRAIIQGTDTALNAQLIRSDQAEAVSKITAQVGPLIDSAKAANDANDPANANKTAVLIKQLLAALGAYVPPAK